MMNCDGIGQVLKKRLGYVILGLALPLLASCSRPNSVNSSQADASQVDASQANSQPQSGKIEPNLVVQEELVKQSIRGRDYEKLARLLTSSIKDEKQVMIRIRAAAQEDLAALRIIYELVPSVKNAKGESPYLAQALRRGKWDIAAFLSEQGERCDASLFRENLDRAPSISVDEFVRLLPIFENQLSEQDWEELWKKNLYGLGSEHIQGWVEHFVKQPKEPPCRGLARYLASMIDDRNIKVSAIPLSIFSTFEHDAKVALANKLIRHHSGNPSLLFSGFLEDFLDDKLQLDQQQLELIKWQWPEQFERMNLAEPTRWSDAFHATVQRREELVYLEPWKDQVRELADKPLVSHYPNQTPLHVAMIEQRYDLVQWMVDHGAVDRSKKQTYTGPSALVANIELNASNTLPLNVSFGNTAYNPLIRAAERHGAEHVVRISRVLEDTPVTQSLRRQATEKFYKAGRFDIVHAVLEASELQPSALLELLSGASAADFLRSIPPHSSASQSLKKNLPEVLTYACSEASAVSTDLVFESLWRCARVEFKQRKIVSLEDLLRAVDKPPATAALSRRSSGERPAARGTRSAQGTLSPGLTERTSQLLNNYVDQPEIFRALIWEGVPVSSETFKKVLEARKLDIAKLILMDLNWRKQNAALLRESLLVALERRDTPIVELYRDSGLEHMLTESQLASISSQLGGT